ncbi:serine/threonine-protein kinase tnni3k-related [Anaeramoeba flamelloides]|uniref:Serine/threonine-protein kinase tnni3k-related n=1 Tax=Anaeramoeba flamelloides TaxID=1746091 RepID=A0ABQ8XWA5_9EUKA|nr:serine/threonine-protein kinase tnni3k-related [Anaeramoeba flamelloides]
MSGELTDETIDILDGGSLEEIKESVNSENVGNEDSMGFTALHYVVGREDLTLEILKYIVEIGSDVNAVDEFNKSPIFDLMEINGNPELIRYLLEKGVDLNIKDETHCTPLLKICKSEETRPTVDILKLIIEFKGDLDISDDDKNTALHVLLLQKKLEIDLIKVLVENGADIDLTNGRKFTPLHILMKRNVLNLDLITYLINKGANPNIPDKTGESVLHLAITNQNTIVQKELKKYISETELQKIVEQSTRQLKKESSALLIKKVKESIKNVQEIPMDQIQMIKKVGKGAFKEVWKGKWSGNIVAVAKLLEASTFTNEQIQELVHEIGLCCQLHHPQIVNFYGACTQDPQNFMLISEFCSNGDLYKYLHSGKRVTKKKKKDISMDIALGIQYLHSYDLIHRDLKTPNILLDDKNRAKLTDFGLTKAVDTSNNVNMNTVVGTPRWMAPELLRGEQDYTNKVDIYAFGIILWEISTGNIPFEDKGPFVLPRFVGYEGGRPEMTKKDLFYEVAIKCWAQEPNERPDIQQVVEELSRVK